MVKKQVNISNTSGQNQNTQIQQKQNTQIQQKQNEYQTHSPSHRYMSKSDIQQLEDYVNEKMNFGLLDRQQKYQKDILNDREDDIELLKVMRDFSYFRDTQSTLDFKNRFNIGKVIGQGAYA